MLISPREATEIVFRSVGPLPDILRPLAQSLGHCLANPVRADRDQPPTDRSAMDGYALIARDLTAPPTTLRLVGESAAGGATRQLKVTTGTCVRILTGAVVPPGADTVIPLEETSESEGCVRFDSPAALGDNIRKRGEEIRKRRVVVPKATRLGGVHIGLCAAVGAAEVCVHRLPRIAVFCTGRELRSARARVQPHQIRNSNGPALSAAVESAGFGKVAHRIVADDSDAITAVIRSAEDADVVIVTGGVSVGRYDFVPACARAAGARVRFHGVRMKPGKPQLYATFPNNRHFFGLPGNPLSVLTGFYEFVLPAMRRLSGMAADQCRPELRVPLSVAVRPHKTRTEYVLGSLKIEGGSTCAVPLATHGSADLASACSAAGMILVEPNSSGAAGGCVAFRPWGPI